jgi:glutathione reductase (NADPH)
MDGGQQHIGHTLLEALVQTKEVKRIKGIYHDVIRNNGIELVEGRASFQDAHTITVRNSEGELVRTLTAANILIATGGKPKVLDIPGAELAITSDEALALPEAPQRVAIIGAGCVATEFAGIFAGMGAHVDMFFRKDLPLSSASPMAIVQVLLICQMCLP